MKTVLLFLAAAGLPAQTLSVSSAMAAPGGKAQVEITLDSPAGKEPLSLQWELHYPAKLLTIEGTPEASVTARQAGKSVACAGHWAKAPVTYTYRCILAGGEKPVANGAVAVFSFRVNPKAQPGKVALHAEAAAAATSGLSRAKLKTQDGAVIVSPAGR